MGSQRRVFYKGRPYEYKVSVTSQGERWFSIYEDGVFVRFVQEGELDNRSPFTIKLDQFLHTLKLTLFA